MLLEREKNAMILFLEIWDSNTLYYTEYNDFTEVSIEKNIINFNKSFVWTLSTKYSLSNIKRYIYL